MNVFTLNTNMICLSNKIFRTECSVIYMSSDKIGSICSVQSISDISSLVAIAILRLNYLRSVESEGREKSDFNWISNQTITLDRMAVTC